MLQVFVDTSYLIAETRPRNQHHLAARAAFDSLSACVLHSTEEVIFEFLAYFSSSEPLRLRALKILDRFVSNPLFVIHPQSHESFEAALELFRRRPDKGYSLCDCRSMVLMEEIGIQNVLTNDEHFSQAGFERLY